MITRISSNLRLSAFICGLTFCLAGCQDQKYDKIGQKAVQDYFNGDYPRAISRLNAVANKTNENYVLNNLRLGSVNLSTYQLDESEAAFLRAWEVINAGGVNSGGRSVAAVWISEKLKIWKGEPYERAIASFNLGLIYYIRHDYNNARACFENSLFKLRDYADEKDEKKNYTEQESNFVLAHLMLGRCWQKLGREDLSQANFDAAKKLQPHLAALADPIVHSESNVLLVVDFGYGPRKVTESDGDVIGFSPTPATAGMIPSPRVIVDSNEYPVHDLGLPTIDTVAMAQDRRWQSIDTIRSVKNAIGRGMMVAGAGYGVYKGAKGDFKAQDAIIVGALMGSGYLLHLSSAADTRRWEMVPRTVFLLPLKLPPGKHDICVSFPESGNLSQTWHALDVPETGDATYYYRMNRWSQGPFDWPPQPIMAPALDSKQAER